MSEELKACPFCGHNASIVRGCRSSQNIFYIRCNICEAIGEKFSSKVPDEAKLQAIEAWNKRYKE